MAIQDLEIEMTRTEPIEDSSASLRSSSVIQDFAIEVVPRNLIKGAGADLAILAGIVHVSEHNPKVSRRNFLRYSAGTAGAALVGTGCASGGIFSPSKEELAFYERLKSAPKGKRPITDFPEIAAGVGNFPTIYIDAEQHTPPIGIDYLVNVSFPWTPIVAAGPGTVKIAEFHPDWGYHIVIRHYGGHETVYAHLQQPLLVKANDRVDRGTIIGFGGNTGNFVRGRNQNLPPLSHLHFATTEPNYELTHILSKSSKDWVKIVNPHLYAENRRLGTWSGSDLDTKFIADDRREYAYFKRLFNQLPEHYTAEINKDAYVGRIVGLLWNLLMMGILQKHVKDDPRMIEGRLERYMSKRLTYTLFVNPKRSDLYNIIVH